MKKLLVLLFLIASPALAQQTTPAQVNGCIYNSSLPILTNGQSSVFQCDVNGKLLVSPKSVAPSGAAGGVLSGTYPNPGFANPLTLPNSTSIGAGSAITSSGSGGSLGSNAFNSTSYLPLAGGTMAGGLVIPSGDLTLNGSGSGSSLLNAPATGGGTATLFPGTDTIVGLAATQTLTNKTLTSPSIGTGMTFLGTNITAITGTSKLVLSSAPAFDSTISLGSVSTANGIGYICYNNPSLSFASGATCGVSAKRFKNSKGEISADLADDRLDMLHPSYWTYKNKIYGNGVYGGLYADDVAAMDPICGTYNKKDGLVNNYDERCVIAYLVADRQKRKAEIEELKLRIIRLESK